MLTYPWGWGGKVYDKWEKKLYVYCIFPSEDFVTFILFCFILFLMCVCVYASELLFVFLISVSNDLL